MYAWLLFAHIASVAGFLLAHGTSAAMAFRLRSEKTTDGIRSLAELSKQVGRARIWVTPSRIRVRRAKLRPGVGAGDLTAASRRP